MEHQEHMDIFYDFFFLSIQKCAAAKDCPAGQYGNKDTNMCVATCPTGYYKSERHKTCKKCKTSCGSGKYRSGMCDGTITTDVVQCPPCKSICPIGYILSGSCKGTGTRDTVNCLPCKTASPCHPPHFFFDLLLDSMYIYTS
jgi:hypothetical protein